MVAHLGQDIVQTGGQDKADTIDVTVAVRSGGGMDLPLFDEVLETYCTSRTISTF